MKRIWKHIISVAVVACMVFSVCGIFVGCGGNKPSGKGEVKVTDGIFTNAKDDGSIVWQLKLKENGTYYNKQAFRYTAGTWELKEKSFKYSATFEEGSTTDTLQVPESEMATATQVIVLSEYGGKTIEYAYADNRIWSVEMDQGMSHKVLVHDPEYKWDESKENPVTVVKYFDAKDSMKSVQLNHNGSFVNSIDNNLGTWTVANNVYTMTYTGGTATLTPNANGAVYKVGTTETQLYNQSFEQIYAFTGKLNAKLKGAQEATEYEFRLALYENGDADIGFYDDDANYTEIESGKYTYAKDTESFTFDFKGTENDKTNVKASGGVYTISYKDVGHEIFEQKSEIPGGSTDPVLSDEVVTLTYEIPALYEMEAVKAQDQEHFGETSIYGNALQVSSMKLQLFTNGKAAIYFSLVMKSSEGTAMPLGEYLLDEGTYEKTTTGYTLNFAKGEYDKSDTITATIDRQNAKVTTDAYFFKAVPIAALGVQVDIENVTFQMPYKKDVLNTFHAQTIEVTNTGNVKFAAESVELVTYNDNTYEIIVVGTGTAGCVVQNGTTEAILSSGSLVGYKFTKTGATEPTFEGNLTSFAFNETVKVVLEEYEDQEVTIGLNVTFSVGETALTAIGSYGSCKIVYGMVDASLTAVALTLNEDGTAVLEGHLTLEDATGNMGAIITAFAGKCYGTLDTATYTVTGNTYTFTFANAGTVTGTVTDGVLTLTYAKTECPFTPLPAYATYVSDVSFADISITLTGNVG